MTKQRRKIARFVYADALPAALIPIGAARDDGGSGDGSEAGEGSDPPEGAEGSSDTGDGDTGTEGAADDGTDDDDPEIVGNPAAKRHADDAKKQRLKAKEATERADELQRQLDQSPGVAAVNEARQERDFYRLAVTEFNDIEAAWKLRDESLISTDDKGMTVGIDAAVKRLKQSYPHLADDPTTDTRSRTTTVPHAPGSGGSPTNPRRPATKATASASTLKSKFPALDRLR